jgi:hypothetical protein
MMLRINPSPVVYLREYEKFTTYLAGVSAILSNSLLVFDAIPVVNVKLPCVSPPPWTNCNPTKLSENVPAPDGFCGGHLYVAIMRLYFQSF